MRSAQARPSWLQLTSHKDCLAALIKRKPAAPWQRGQTEVWGWAHMRPDIFFFFFGGAGGAADAAAATSAIGWKHL